jgi:vitamin B12 transporter
MSIRPVSALALLSLSFHVLAADEASLDPVLVTATRTALPVSDTLAPTLVIDREELERSLAADVSELLRFVAGLELARNGGPGQTTSLFLRGTESNHTLVLIDGVEMNPGTIGGAALQNLPLDAIERIEIVKGPRSALYGSEAIGGVINIITRRGAGTQASVGAGRYGLREAQLGAGTRNAAWDARLDLAQRRFDGFAIQDSSPVARGNERDSVNLRVGWQGEAVAVGLRHADSQGTTEYLDFVATPISQDFTNRVSALAVDLEAATDWHLGLVVARAIDEIVQRQPNGFTGADDFLLTARDSAELQADWTPTAHQTLSLGTHWSDEDAQVESFGRYGTTTRVTAWFVEHQWRGDTQALTSALRRTDHESFGSHTAWSLDYGRALGADWRLNAGLGTGFRAPDATDLYSPCCGNPALRPETARNLELGLRWTPRPGDRVTLSVHQQRIDDLIAFGPLFVLENIDAARIRGLELGWEHSGAAWRTRLGAVLQDTEDEATGAPLPRRADRQFTAALARAVGRHEFGLDLLAHSERKDSGFSTLVNGGYLLANLTARFTLSERWTLRAQLDNLLDKDYATAAGYNEPGRALSLRLSWRSE